MQDGIERSNSTRPQAYNNLQTAVERPVGALTQRLVDLEDSLVCIGRAQNKFEYNATLLFSARPTPERQSNKAPTVSPASSSVEQTLDRLCERARQLATDLNELADQHNSLI